MRLFPKHQRTCLQKKRGEADSLCEKNGIDGRVNLDYLTIHFDRATCRECRKIYRDSFTDNAAYEAARNA